MGIEKEKYNKIKMLNLLLFTIGFAGLATGIVLTPTPVPGTTLLIILSLGLMIHTSSLTERVVRWLRNRFPTLHERVVQLEDKFEHRVTDTLKKTRPK